MKFSIALFTVLLCGCAAQPVSQTLQPSENSGPDRQDVGTACEVASASGHVKEANLAEIAKIFRTENFTKKEFESSEEFEKRIAKVVERANKLKDSGVLTVVIPIGRGALKYNADTNEMEIGYSRGVLSTEKADIVTASESEDAVGSYIGSNAYGAQKKVIKYKRSVLGISFPGSHGEWDVNWPNSYQPIKVSMTRDDAITAIKGSKTFGVLFMGELAPPYFERRSSRETPKIDFAFDTKSEIEVIKLNVDCAAIYNRSTKKIIQEIPFTRTRF